MNTPKQMITPMKMPYEVDLLCRLVRIDTDANTKRGYVECSELIRKESENIGLKTRVYDSRDSSGDRKPRPCVVADLDVGAEQKVLLATHYDVVPAGAGWKHPPFNMEVIHGRAFGRGTSDDKGGIAAALSAMKELTHRRGKVNVSLLVTPDEEVGGKLGMGYLVDNIGIGGDAAVIIDSSIEAVSIGASGVVCGRVLIRGRQGHAGTPHKALNAIDLSLPLLSRLSKYSKTRERVLSKVRAPPGSPHRFIHGRFSLTMLNSGVKENIIPGICETRFDLRTNPDENVAEAKRKLTKYLRASIRKLGLSASLEYTETNPNYVTNPNQPIVRKLVQAAKSVTGKTLPVVGEFGGNDGRFLADRGIPVVCYGPGRANNRFHGVDEFLYLKDLETTKMTIVNLCEEW